MVNCKSIWAIIAPDCKYIDRFPIGNNYTRLAMKTQKVTMVTGTTGSAYLYTSATNSNFSGRWITMGDSWSPENGSVGASWSYANPNINWNDIGRMRFLGLSLDATPVSSDVYN
jgi:hypothetical protein